MFSFAAQNDKVLSLISYIAGNVFPASFPYVSVQFISFGVAFVFREKVPFIRMVPSVLATKKVFSLKVTIGVRP